MKNCIVVRGAGDLATAVIHKLHNSGFKVVALEIEEPLAIRRQIFVRLFMKKSNC